MNRRSITAFGVYFLLVGILLTYHYPSSTSRTGLFLLEPIYATIDGLRAGRRSLDQWLENRTDLKQELSRRRFSEVENRRLRDQIRDLRSEMSRLREKLDLAERREEDLVLAEVIQVDLGPLEHQVRVRLRENHKVADEAAAITFRNDQGLLWGTVETATGNTAQVRGIRDSRSRVGVQIESFPDRHWVAEGAGKDGLRIDPVPAYLEVETGESVQTSPVSTLVRNQWLVGSVRRRKEQSATPGNVSLMVEPAAPRTVRYLWLETSPDD